MRLLPPPTIPARVVSISIAVPPHSSSAPAAGSRTVERYAQLFDRYGIPASWGVADFPLSDEFREILQRSANHEIAIAAGPEAIDMQAGRSQFCKQLRRRLAAARADGLGTTTLVLRKTPSMQHLDILVRAGIAIVASDRPVADFNGRRAAVHTLRFGLWEIPSSLPVSGSGGWASAFSVRRQIDRAMDSGQLLHVAIDISRETPSTTTLRQVERVLQHLDQRRREDRLQIRTMSDVASELPRGRSGASAHSILRRRESAPRAA